MHTPKMQLENKIAIFEEDALYLKHKRMEERKSIAPTQVSGSSFMKKRNTV